jgi:hypothetical protein
MIEYVHKSMNCLKRTYIVQIAKYINGTNDINIDYMCGELNHFYYIYL